MRKAIDNGDRVKTKGYEKIYDISLETNPNSRFIVFAMSTTGILGTNALKFLRHVCGLDDIMPAAAGEEADPEPAMAMRNITTALSCATTSVRGGAFWDAVDMYGYQERPQFDLTPSCKIPVRRNGVDGSRASHPSSALWNPSTGAGRVDERVFAYVSPFDVPITARSPPPTQPPTIDLHTPPPLRPHPLFP